jgi:hypothetical protein
MDRFADLLVHYAGPDVVRRRQVELPRVRLLHQPGDERFDLLRRHRAGAEDERVALLPLVLLRVDVERLALHDGGALDRLPRGAVDAAEDHIDPVLPDELGGLGGRDTVRRGTVLEDQIEPSPQQPALGVDLVDHHPGHVRIGDADERQGPRLVSDHAHLDGLARRRGVSVCSAHDAHLLGWSRSAKADRVGRIVRS